MTWRGPRTTRDPLLTTSQWRKNREHWKKLRLPCSRCGKAIDYDGPRYFAASPALCRHYRCTKRVSHQHLNPRYLVVGHKVARFNARDMGWGEDRINALVQTWPECQDCSNRSGAKLGQKVQSQRMATRRVILDESRRW
jgi:hypothetical protein